MGPGSIATYAHARSAPAAADGPMPSVDSGGQAQLSFAGDWPCPEYRRDYVKLAAWVFALLFGPALAALGVLLAS